jgi:glucuronate isomerase
MRRWTLSPDRCFDADPAQREVARRLYAAVEGLPLVCPHGHVDPALLADPGARFTSPAELFVIPDHYVFRMLYSQGVPLEDLGVPARDGTLVEQDHRRIWQRFAEHFELFRGTPTGLWLSHELVTLFGVEEKLDRDSAQRIYDRIAAQLALPEFSPRALFARFNIETLCTTDPATSDLAEHRRLRDEGYRAVRPTFRPDAVVHLDAVGWREQIERLAMVSGIDVVDYSSFIRALEQRRAFFKSMGATATDHACLTPYTARLTHGEASAVFDHALRGDAGAADAARFDAHMLIEMARMSAEDGLVMQIHAGSRRDYDASLYARFGPDKGADIPVATDWTANLHALLNGYGNDRRIRLILFTLDESTYGRELAPLAGLYPSVLLGPPWWFHDSVNGMTRYLYRVMETAGLRNTAGFNDDTRAFPSIPSRHDVWRRVTCNWLAGLLVRGLIDEDDAVEMAHDCAYRLARRAYRLDGESE